MNDKTADQWASALVSLRGDLAKAEAKADRLEAKRAPDVLAARLGDQPAMARAAHGETTIAAAQRGIDDLKLAINQAETAKIEAEAGAAATLTKANLAEAAALDAEAERKARSIDAALASLGDTMSEIESLLMKATRLRGRTDGQRIGRARRAFRGAAWFYGIKVGDHVPTQHRAPFAQAVTHI